ncbi:DUF3710 domain-containing protein [Demequina globuliformis]|uniref:DUF3710 domain-containing protein n=1 Tax=Demequina globuliformis TaxID=676202 RepID=UPI000784BD52|nr:DUF3710 domain-containing protein [Demequina globuliformis]
MTEDQGYDDGLDELTGADGPWDWDQIPADQDFVYYGPLRLPAIAHMKVRAEIDPSNDKCGAVSVKIADCQVQLQVLAAPRGTGQWTQTRRTITERLRPAGEIHVTEGRFGPEIEARLTRKNKQGEDVMIPMRFFGPEGDRWLLKAAAMGPSVHEDSTRERIADFLSRCAVERGPQPMIAGTVLVLDFPRFRKDGDEPQTEQAGADSAS